MTVTLGSVPVPDGKEKTYSEFGVTQVTFNPRDSLTDCWRIRREVSVQRAIETANDNPAER